MRHRPLLQTMIVIVMRSCNCKQVERLQLKTGRVVTPISRRLAATTCVSQGRQAASQGGGMAAVLRHPLAAVQPWPQDNGCNYLQSGCATMTVGDSSLETQETGARTMVNNGVCRPAITSTHPPAASCIIQQYSVVHVPNRTNVPRIARHALLRGCADSSNSKR